MNTHGYSSHRWTPIERSWTPMDSHGLPWASTGLAWSPIGVQWASMGFNGLPLTTMGLCRSLIGLHRLPWVYHRSHMGSPMGSHPPPWVFCRLPWTTMNLPRKFHGSASMGIPWTSEEASMGLTVSHVSPVGLHGLP